MPIEPGSAYDSDVNTELARADWRVNDQQHQQRLRDPIRTVSSPLSTLFKCPLLFLPTSCQSVNYTV